MVTLALGRWAFGQAGVAMSDAVLLGTVAFATLAPMQMRVLQQAGAAGANLASSLNISAFNLGNALGAWVGGLLLSHGFGLLALGEAAAGLTAVGLLLTGWSWRAPAGRRCGPCRGFVPGGRLSQRFSVKSAFSACGTSAISYKNKSEFGAAAAAWRLIFRIHTFW